MDNIISFIKSFLNHLSIGGQTSSSDWLGWILGFISGIFVLMVIQKMQTNIARNQMIYDLEKDINKILIRYIQKMWH